MANVIPAPHRSVLRPLTDGQYRVTGTTKVTGTPDTPVARRVRLHDKITGLPLRDVWSDSATGEYAFRFIRGGTFYVIAFDHTGLYAPVAESDVTPEPMP